jgi:glyoxalase/bleomycin resistance protein/dioxygenase superfamily protein
MSDALLQRIAQIGLVVHSVQRSAEQYWKLFGIGPWRIKTLDPSNVADMTVHGLRVEHAMRIGIAMIGELEWELIEPLDDRSIYAEHLRRHGEGLHHLLFDVGSYEKTCALFHKTGATKIAGGTWHGFRYAYFDTRHTLACLSEIYSPPPPGTPLPPPDYTYP